MNNAPYEKTIENVAKRSDIWLIVDEQKAIKLVEKPHCIDFWMFSENLFNVEISKNKSLINKPFHVIKNYVINKISIVFNMNCK